MDLFDIKLRLEVSRIHSVRKESTVLNVHILRILYAVAALRADRLHANRFIIIIP